MHVCACGDQCPTLGDTNSGVVHSKYKPEESATEPGEREFSSFEEDKLVKKIAFPLHCSQR